MPRRLEVMNYYHFVQISVTIGFNTPINYAEAKEKFFKIHFTFMRTDLLKVKKQVQDDNTQKLPYCRKIVEKKYEVYSTSVLTTGVR